MRWREGAVKHRARYMLSAVVFAWSCGAAATEPVTGQFVAAYAPGTSAPDSRLFDAERSTRRDPQTAVLLSILGDHYRAQSRFQEAELLYWRSLAIFREKLGMRDPNVGTAEHKLGQLHYLRGSYAAAVPHYQRALSVFGRSLGAEHPSVIALILDLAGVYYMQGRLADAEGEYKRALAILNKERNADERSLELARNGLAAVFEAQGRGVEAELTTARGPSARGGPVVLRQRPR